MLTRFIVFEILNYDPNDFDMGQRHNLDVIRILADDGKVNENGGKYHGQDRYEARKNIVSDLQELGLMEKIEGMEKDIVKQ